MGDFEEAMKTPEGRQQWWARDREETEARLRADKPRDADDALAHKASIDAADWAKQTGLYPERFSDDNEGIYRVQQGLRAAHWAREDAAATLILMRPVLRRLRGLKKLLWVTVVLLALILWRVW